MTAPFLLDTCAALWIANNRIKQATSDALTEAYQAGRLTYLSPITGWEIGLLASRGKFMSHFSPSRWLQHVLGLPYMKLAEMSPQVLLDSCFLPGVPPRDPADRIIAATAREYGYTVVTRDRALLDYAAAGHLRALEC
jgi:PIN domain nuclease of toxin-antitoxin system